MYRFFFYVLCLLVSRSGSFFLCLEKALTFSSLSADSADDKFMTQSTLIIWTSLILNNCISWTENLVPLLTSKSNKGNRILWKRGEIAWLSWMRRPTGDQEIAGSTPNEVGNILSWRLIMKYFLRSFSPFRWFKKGSCQFLAKECAQYWLTA